MAVSEDTMILFSPPNMTGAPLLGQVQLYGGMLYMKYFMPLCNGVILSQTCNDYGEIIIQSNLSVKTTLDVKPKWSFLQACDWLTTKKAEKVCERHFSPIFECTVCTNDIFNQFPSVQMTYLPIILDETLHKYNISLYCRPNTG